MEQYKESGIRAGTTAVTAVAFLLVVLLLLKDRVSISGEGVYIIASLIGSFLVGVVLYQFMRMKDKAEFIAREMTKSMLSHSHEIFSVLFRNSSVPFVVIDEDGVIEATNSATALLFNVELDALLGLNIFDFIEGDDQHKTALIPSYFKQGKIVNDVEVKLRRPDGIHRFVLLALFSFRDTTNVEKGLVTLIDITKQKMVDKAKTEFVSLASHQLRTPISGMKWNIELLTAGGNENLTSTQHEYLGKIANGLERMDMLVADFLSASKFELGTLTAQYTSFAVVPFLKSVVEELQDLATKKRIKIVTSLDESEGVIVSDSHLFHMITSNLLSNAVKYTPEGGSVTMRALLDSAHLTVTVTDTGMGIPPEERDMIFSKLFRASNAKTQVTDGTGLGLYIVKEAVKILGGTIGFVSEVGKGTTFTVVLPK